MAEIEIDALLKGVKSYWTEDKCKHVRRFEVHSILNDKLWSKIEKIWGEDWVQMRDIIIGNDYEIGGRYACVPEETWLDMVGQLKERLFIVHTEIREFDGKTRSYYWKVWDQSKEDVIKDIDPNRPEVVEWEVLEAEHNKRNRYIGAWEIYQELMTALAKLK